jgi:hypothetical protein
MENNPFFLPPGFTQELSFSPTGIKRWIHQRRRRRNRVVVVVVWIGF